MKIKLLVAALAALGATSALAQAYDATKSPCKVARAADPAKGVTALSVADALAAMPLHCRPEVTLFITGASAPNNAVRAAVPEAVLETANRFRITVDTTDNLVDSASVGWYGIGKSTLNAALTGKRIYIVYSNRNGSLAGVNQVISTKTLEAEALTVVPGDNGQCAYTSGSVASNASTAAVSSVYTCTKEAKVESVMAFSDVLPHELDHAELKKANNAKMPDTFSQKLLKTTPLALQGFGVAVNKNLYLALQARDVRLGRLPATCTSTESYAQDADLAAPSALGASCRPNLSSYDYAALVAQGGVTTANSWLGTTSDSKLINVQRRVATSGTQAASNIFFLRNYCQGYGRDLANAVTNDVLKNVSVSLTGANVKSSFGGAIAPRGAGTYGSVIVTEQAETGGVRDALANDTVNYSIGVVSLDNDEGAVTTSGATALTGDPLTNRWRYVRLDGADPMISDSNTVDRNNRSAVISGRWPFSFEFQSVAKSSKTVGVNELVAAVQDSLKNSATPLRGLAYLPGNTAAASTLLSKVKRAGGNNCAPLTPVL